ncbi:uncharacterized protein STAUR_1107 [Stigmatella aurantiaca DW4/3-1]|uniref:Cellulose biosynthesis protein BcsS n=2 Tax=Stigmatella aurantiaca (strain DW4/3-1) TaxID=378806 RepID=E3FET0_STIAD|nr:uncharacterized protein STAUR_1107 [Stigmatella aurantiaca DW4/3-1]
MMSSFRFLLLLWVLSAAGGAQAQAPTEPTPALTPLYPLWENTGFLLPHRGLYVGSSQAELGLFDVAQVGVHPLFFVFRTLNAHAKVRLLSDERLSVAAHAEVLVFLPGAGEAFVSSNYVSRLDTSDSLLTVVPVGATASYALTSWLYLHGTATVMGMLDHGPFENRAVLGTTGVAEVLALQHHSVSLHLGEVGFWNHDFASLGGSYRYRRSWFELKLGYFYRFMEDGRQGSPLLAVGAYL